MKPAFDRQVVDDYRAIAQTKSPGPANDAVIVFMKTLPPGLTMTGGAISVDVDSNRMVIGTFDWRGVGLLPSEDLAPSELAKIAQTAGGNELVILDATISRGYLTNAKGLVLLNREPALSGDNGPV